MNLECSIKGLAAAVAAGAVFALAGCAAGMRQGTPVGYDLGTPAWSASATAASPKTARAPIVLDVSSAGLPNDANMIWRVDASQNPRSYSQARWIATPVQLMTQLLVRRLSSQGPVLTEGAATQLTRVRVNLMRFEQDFSADGKHSEGRIALQVLVLRDRRVLGQTRIERAVPANTQDAAGGAAALAKAAEQAGDALAEWLAKVPV